MILQEFEYFSTICCKILTYVRRWIGLEQQDFEKIYEEYKQQSDQQAHIEAEQGNSSGKEEFVAVKKNDDGDIIAFKTSSGRELDYITALKEAKAGNLAHVDVFH